ncbi:MAG: 4-phosphopantoate--beta-alanine ligase [Thermoplasmata archaeon]
MWAVVNPFNPAAALLVLNYPIPPSHPRYGSLVVREKLVVAAQEGLVAWEGLVAHGRGEAFDYLLGERTVPEAKVAAQAAAAYLLRAQRPVLSVNGNVAVLAAEEVRELAKATGARVEVNVFHRTKARVDALVARLEERGIPEVLGRDPDASLPGLDHPRALCSREGLYGSDVVLVPLEDGDRAEALVGMHKTVLSIDLNPLSRTSRAATVAIVDEVVRALQIMVAFAREVKGRAKEVEAAQRAYEKQANLRGVLEAIRKHLEAQTGTGKKVGDNV